MDKDKLAKSTTTDGKPAAPGLENAGAPQPIGASGQHGAYWILTEEERGMGFVRPVRTKYKHVGLSPATPLRQLSAEEVERYSKFKYIGYEVYPESKSPVTGRYWTQEQLDGGCGCVTSMGRAIAETYARDPGYYGSTFCVGCNKHLPVDEFVWAIDGEVVGS